MAKFKVGDIIKANKKSNSEYCITSQERNWTGKILSIENGLIYAETITPEEYKGDKYRLLEKYFDLVEDKQNMMSIVNKNTVIVILDDGRKGVAKCSPDDKFNLAFGTSLAVARAYGDKETEAKLLAEPSEPVKEKPTFKIGELVRIRQWDDMEKEFGTNTLGTINTQQGFLRKMEPLCGKYAEITELDKGNRVLLKFFNCEGLEYLTEVFAFATDVIEKV